MDDETKNQLIELLKRDRRFSIESYRLVNEALTYAQNVLGAGESQPSETDEHEEVRPIEKHVTGQDLSWAVLKYALNQYGYMAALVLKNLGIRTTGDIGDIVYNMIQIGYMRKTHEDRREDFDEVFDLSAELQKGFAFNYKKN